MNALKKFCLLFFLVACGMTPKENYSTNYLTNEPFSLTNLGQTKLPGADASTNPSPTANAVIAPPVDATGSNTSSNPDLVSLSGFWKGFETFCGNDPYSYSDEGMATYIIFTGPVLLQQNNYAGGCVEQIRYKVIEGVGSNEETLKNVSSIYACFAKNGKQDPGLYDDHDTKVGALYHVHISVGSDHLLKIHYEDGTDRNCDTGMGSATDVFTSAPEAKFVTIAPIPAKSFP